MKFLVCGSGDSCGIPAVFCRCPVCQSARRNGGEEVRTRTGYLLDETVKFDFGPDTLLQSHKLGFDLTKLEHLFITHSHSDHFDAGELWNQSLAVPGSDREVTVYGNEKVIELLAPYRRDFGFRLQTRVIRSGETIRTRSARITAIATGHIPTEECLMFHIGTPVGDILIANDSDRFPESAFTLLRGRRIDHLFIDCTWGVEHRENQGHMGLPAIRKIVMRLRGEGVLRPDSKIWPVHISHLGVPLPYAEFCNILRAEGFSLAYDGMMIVSE